MKTILSLFDHTCTWPIPYLNDGEEVIPFDLDSDNPVDVNDMDVAWFEETGIEWCDGILAAPPCTDFTVSGAQYWKAKDASGQTEKSLELGLQALRCVEYWQPDFWAIENPVGRFGKLTGLGPANLIFDPCDYAGYLCDKYDIMRLDDLRARHWDTYTQDDINFVWATNAYTKKTCIWGEFNLPEKKRIEPIRCCKAGSPLMLLGGKTDQTKRIRSNTPAGFSMAFYLANNWKGLDEEKVAEYREERFFNGNEDALNPFLNRPGQMTLAM